MSRCKSNMKVVAYRKDGTLFRIYDSAKKASLNRHAHPRTIDKCIRGESLTAFNYMWRRYPEDQIPERIPPLEIKEKSYESIPIMEIDINGNIVHQYQSIRNASKALIIDSHSIRDNLKGKTKTVKGHIFKYNQKK